MTMENYKIIFVVFIIIVILERLWETFFRKKALETGSIVKKWTLWALTFVYILVMSSTILEYFFMQRRVNYAVSAFGLLLFVLALFGRNISIKTLGRFHSINIEIKPNHKIIRHGPYKYLRHPYYLSIMLEVLGMPLIGNSFYAFYLALFAYVPLVLIRTYFEECMMVNKFGETYAKYKSEVHAFFPFQKTQRGL